MDSHPADDADAIQLAVAGDQRGFARLVELYQDRIFTIIFRSLGDAATAEDLSQEVFLNAFSALASFDQRAKFSTWLYRIAMNAVVSHLRHRKAHKRGGARVARSLNGEDGMDPAADLRTGGESATADAALLRAEADSDVQQALDALEPEQREVAVLRDIEGLSYEEIAEVLGLNINTVRSRLHRARETLRHKLKHLME